MKSKASDPSALHVVLLQEVERYNSLLLRLRSSCSQVQAGLKGLVVMSADLDEIADALFNAKVHPPLLPQHASQFFQPAYGFSDRSAAELYTA